MKREYLLEVGCENLPSGYLGGALDQLRLSFENGLAEERIGFDSISVQGTPNRLVVHVKGISEGQSSSVQTVPGPPVSVAIDGDGNFTKAAEGFARREGVSPDQLERIKTERGEYLAIVKKISGRDTRSILIDTVPGWISGIRFPKVMKWESSGFRFARPIRWVLSLLGDEVLKFEVGPVTSSGETRLSPYFTEFTSVGSVKEYYETLKASRIILDHDRRKKRVAELAEKTAIEAGGRLVVDDQLCGMVANLVESPVVMSGSFDSGFLKLPREVIVTALKSHQRYFCVEDEEGRLKPAFIAFADGATKNKKEITRGYERVLQARLADAGFYFQEDSSRPIEEMAAKLADIVWLEGLGTLKEKSERIAAIASFIVSEASLPGESLETVVKRSALLMKADIASEMVKDGKEFTLLQGYIGREYARSSGEVDEVSEAIYEHYFPRFSGDRLPEGSAGTVLSLSDRFDTIAGCYIQGLGPTGSQDPYALRRHAISILRILLENRLALGVGEMISRSFDQFSEVETSVEGGKEVLQDKALELFNQRFLGMLKSEGYDHDLVSASLSSPWTVPFAVLDTVGALQAMRGEGRLAEFILAMKRIANIIPKKMRETVTRDKSLDALTALAEGDTERLGFSTTLFSEDAERAFHASAEGVARKLVALRLPEETSGSLAILEELVPDINSFFEDVLINCEDEKVRANRLNFLKGLGTAFGLFCDYSQVTAEQQ